MQNPNITIKINEIVEKYSQFAKKWLAVNQDICIKKYNCLYYKVL